MILGRITFLEWRQFCFWKFSQHIWGLWKFGQHIWGSEKMAWHDHPRHKSQRVPLLGKWQELTSFSYSLLLGQFHPKLEVSILLWKGPPKLCIECHLVPQWTFPPKSHGWERCQLRVVKKLFKSMTPLEWVMQIFATSENGTLMIILDKTELTCPYGSINLPKIGSGLVSVGLRPTSSLE